jgi:hypothetical protein
MTNKTHIIQGPKDIARGAAYPLDAFLLFISNTIIDEIVTNTNAEILVRSQSYTKEKGTAFLTSSMNNHLSTQELFDGSLSGTTYKATMSRERFKFLINYLRFDNTTTRAARKETDTLASTKSIWDQLFHNSKNSYKAQTAASFSWSLFVTHVYTKQTSQVWVQNCDGLRCWNKIHVRRIALSGLKYQEE